VNPDPATERKLQTIDLRSDRPAVVDGSPRWTGSNAAFRILVITHTNSDFGMDSLYDGLCQVLGADNVVEFPWKPCLHGQEREVADGYPCTFDHPGTPMTAEQFIEALRAGQFNLILFADMVERRDAEVVRAFLAAAPRVPVVVYDTWDDCMNQQGPCTEYFNGREPDIYPSSEKC